MKHYIMVDGEGRIVGGRSDGPNPREDSSNEIVVTEGDDIPFQFYLPGFENLGMNPSLFTGDNIPLYCWDGEGVVARTQEEIDADRPPVTVSEYVAEPSMASLVKVLQAMAPTLPLNAAVEAPELYPAWKPGVAYGGEGQPILVSRMVDNKPLLFQCQSPHTSQEDWVPENTPSLWFQVVKEGTGTYDDPLVVGTSLSQQYYQGKYYLEDEVKYLCTRDSGIPIAYKPSQLIGQYFEVVT